MKESGVFLRTRNITINKMISLYYYDYYYI